jgi:hypothetical protein
VLHRGSRHRRAPPLQRRGRSRRRAAGSDRQIRRRAQRLPRRVENRQHLVPPELDERPARLLDRLARQLREACGQARRGLVAALLREPRVAAHVGDQEGLDPGFDNRHRRIVRFRAN